MPDADADDCHVLIAGAGLAGALLAYRCSQAGLKVVLLEAGERPYFDLKTGEDQREALVQSFFSNPVKMTNSGYPDLAYAPSPSETTLNKYYVQHGPQPFQSTYNRFVGGTTYHWLGTCLRFTPNSFQEHSRYGRGIDWPVRYADLQDWYWQAESELGVAGDSAVDLGAPRGPDQPYPMPPILPTYNDRIVRNATEGLRFEGLPVEFRSTPQARNSVPYQGRPVCAGSANCIPVCPIQAKYDASVHLKWALNPRLAPSSTSTALPAELITSAVAVAVSLDAQRRIDGLRVRHPDRSEQVLRARLYVLAMNAIETPKLLLMSASERAPQGVANGSGVVGRYLMDHDVKITYAKLPRPAYLFRGPLSTSGCESLRDGPFRSGRAAFRIELQNTGTSWATGSPFNNVIDLVNRGFSGRRLREQLAWDVSTQIELNGLIEPEPLAENCIRPSERDFDPLGIPRPEIRYRIGDYTQAGTEAFVASARLIYERLGASGISEVPGWFGAGHLMGTTRMGGDERSSCCDSYGRSHEHSNLFLLGCGMFPTVDAANPTLTLAALVLRSAQHIIDSLRPSDSGPSGSRQEKLA